MHLALGGPRSDRAPGDQVGDVLRRDHVEILGAGGQVEFVDLEQDASREAQSLVDAETVVEAGIVDETLPADRSTRLLEIHAHHDDETVGELVLQRGEARGVIDGRVVVVYRAWPHHDQHAVVGAVQYAMHGLARFEGCRGGLFRGRELTQQVCGRREFGDFGNAGIVDRPVSVCGAIGGCTMTRGG